METESAKNGTIPIMGQLLVTCFGVVGWLKNIFCGKINQNMNQIKNLIRLYIHMQDLNAENFII